MIVLDTHVLVWWVNGSNQLSAKAQKLIEEHLGRERSILVSSISSWEIAMLVNAGRLVLTMDVESWLQEVGRIKGVEFVPVDNDVAVRSIHLPGEFHKDPADRMIVALARQRSFPLITADEKILKYKHVKSVF